MSELVVLLAILYFIGLSLLTLYSFAQLYLTIQYLRKKVISNATSIMQSDDCPMVTVQLPIYNEAYVIERLIKSVCDLDYPKEKLEIQVLDDSDDESVAMTTRLVAEYQIKGFDIQHIRRADRIGFKAGALQHGLSTCQGEFIAIFDADFIPDPTFLRQLLPHFDQSHIGMVQARWTHLNENQNMLTKAQAVGLDGHFTVEQSGRQQAGAFLNFNGTAGIWRKTCILDSGGWQHDTLTEDLDLSYRAQLNGWKMRYVENITVAGELPIAMHAIKSQQYRWTKGAAENAKKHLFNIWTSELSFKQKILSFFHLTGSVVFSLLFLTAILSWPVLVMKVHDQLPEIWFQIAILFVSGFIAISVFYWVAIHAVREQTVDRIFIRFISFMSYSMGLCWHNSVAVWSGLIGKKSPFIRTPKFNQIPIKQNRYIKKELKSYSIIEGLLMLYFVSALVYGVTHLEWGLVPFHLMLTWGFGMHFWNGIYAN